MQPKGKSAQTTTVGAPVGGWNARDALGEMPPIDAITMQNMFPLPSDVMLRKGYTNFSTGLPAQVESIMVYNSPSTQKMFGASGTAFYDASAGGAIGAAVMSTLTNALWQSQNISTPGGNFIMCVNGFDKLRGYNGTAWWTDGDGTHDITGVNTATCRNICLAHTRIWLTEKASLRVWYLPVNSIAGLAAVLDFSSIAKKGGYLVGMNAWTIDAGAGMNDYTVFFTSNGEIIVYTGADPTSATTWSLTGVWALGAPLGPRCSMKWGGDLLLLTLDGILPMSSSLQSSRLDPKVAISNKIYTAISNATTAYQGNFGWDMLYYPKANMLIINIPMGVGQQQQYVMNTITQAWCNFTNMNANCWALFNDEPYFGGNGVISRAWNGFSDNSTNIFGITQQAFNYFSGSQVQQMQSSNGISSEKRFTMARPILFSNGFPATLISMNTDFNQTINLGLMPQMPYIVSLWGSSMWGSSIWSGGLSVIKDWEGLSGIGYCGSINLQITSQGIETHWMSTDIVYEQGGTL